MFFLVFRFFAIFWLFVSEKIVILVKKTNFLEKNDAFRCSGFLTFWIGKNRNFGEKTFFCKIYPIKKLQFYGLTGKYAGGSRQLLRFSPVFSGWTGCPTPNFGPSFFIKKLPFILKHFELLGVPIGLIDRYN